MTVVCLGETMALIAPDPPVPLTVAQHLLLGCAGAESNVAMSLAALGTPAAWCSRLGDDPLGERVRAEIAAAGVRTDLVRMVSGARTGVLIKSPAPEGTAVLYYRDASAAAGMDESDVDRALAERPRLLVLSGVTAALSESCSRAVDHALRAAPAAGVPVCFDVNFRPRLWPDRAAAAARLRELAQRCDIVFVGLDEAAALWSTATAGDVRAALDGPPTLVVKDGSRAATSFADSRHVVVPAVPVAVREPVGAGDAFAAGWLHGHLTGMRAEQALRLGHLVAAASLRSVSDVAPIPADEFRALACSDGAWPPRLFAEPIRQPGREDAP